MESLKCFLTAVATKLICNSMKRALYLFALLISSLMLLSNASAQLEVSIRTTQTQFLAGESIVVGVTITNRTGNDIILASKGRTPWLDFVVKRGNGEAVSSVGRGDFAPVKIGAGQTMAKSIEISKLFHLKEQDTYTVSAVIRPTGDAANGFVSNRILFTTANARADWSQKVGVPGSNGLTREYRLMNFTNSQKTQLYCQLIDSKTGTSMQTLNLGEALLFRKPQAAVDKVQTLHVLYLATPEFYVLARIDINGRFLGRELHQRGGAGDPKLVTFGDGSVKVSGSVLYDPKAAAKQEGKIRNISERPPYTYN